MIFSLQGWTEMDLTRLPAPTKTAKECTLDIYENEALHPRMSLFEKKKIHGFWPVFDDSMGIRELTVSFTSCPSSTNPSTILQGTLQGTSDLH